MSTKIRCVIVDDEPVAREILQSFVAKTPTLQLIASCKNAMEAIEVIQENEIDLFFLDINMPEITGLSLAKIINKKSHVIFTTAYRGYAVDGFNLQATDYLLKPIAFDRFLQAVQKVSNNSTSQEKEVSITHKESIFVRSDRKMIKIDLTSVLYIESLGDYVKIFTEDKTIITRETMRNISDKLPTKSFLRIHRSFIISTSKIESFTNEFIEVNNKALPISRSYKESVLQKLAEM